MNSFVNRPELGRIFLLNLLALLFVAGCSVDDEDKCSGNYEWSTKFDVCLRIETDIEEDSDTDTVAPIDTDSATDMNDTDSATDAKESGVGVACMTDTDCTEYQATKCLVDPTEPAAGGMCTILNCVAADCPTADFVCCDCTSAMAMPGFDTTQTFCVVATQSDLLVGTLGCVCN